MSCKIFGTHSTVLGPEVTSWLPTLWRAASHSVSSSQTGLDIGSKQGHTEGLLERTARNQRFLVFTPGLFGGSFRVSLLKSCVHPTTILERMERHEKEQQEIQTQTKCNKNSNRNPRAPPEKDCQELGLMTKSWLTCGGVKVATADWRKNAFSLAPGKSCSQVPKENARCWHAGNPCAGTVPKRTKNLAM